MKYFFNQENRRFSVLKINEINFLKKPTKNSNKKPGPFVKIKASNWHYLQNATILLLM